MIKHTFKGNHAVTSQNVGHNYYDELNINLTDVIILMMGNPTLFVESVVCN